MFKSINVHQTSALLAILAFGIFITLRWYHAEEIILVDAIILGIAAGMLPVAIILIIFPFQSKLKLKDLKRLSLQIVIGGLVLLYIYSKTIIDILFGTTNV